MTDVTHAVWSEKFDYIALGNEFEISLFSPETGETRILTRSSEPIHQFLWYDNFYLVLLQGTAVRILEVFATTEPTLLSLVEGIESGGEFLPTEGSLFLPVPREYFSGSLCNEFSS